MGNMHLLAAATKSSSTSLLPIIIIVVLFMLVYMTMTRRNRARQAQQAQTGIVPGTAVRTTSGMYGTVTSVLDNDDVMVEVSPGVSIRMMKRAVVPVPQDASTGVPPEPPVQDTDTGAEDDSSTAATEDHEQRADDWNPQDRNI
jgi:preprotein translocase subunit YajC